MDIEEEDPTDSPFCNEREKTEKNQLPSCVQNNLEPAACEWDYLQIKTPTDNFEKLCNFVEKDGDYFVGQDDYTYDDYFTNFVYSDVNNQEVLGWYEGKKFDSNIVEVSFAADNLANFYGFKLSWNVWSINPCMTSENTCHTKATCSETDVEGKFKCACKDGFIGDGFDCRGQNKMIGLVYTQTYFSVFDNPSTRRICHFSLFIP